MHSLSWHQFSITSKVQIDIKLYGQNLRAQLQACALFRVKARRQSWASKQEPKLGAKVEIKARAKVGRKSLSRI